MILSCVHGTNAELFAQALQLWVPKGSIVADVTYGRGVFWRLIPECDYIVWKSDLLDGIDFRAPPYPNASVDALVLDPPYMHDGKSVKASINSCYKNQHTSHESTIASYLAGVLEARRVLKRHGMIFIKCQPEIESGKQRLSHVELLTILPLIGFRIEDEFVLHQSTIPALQHTKQQHARKNHSYLLVGRFLR